MSVVFVPQIAVIDFHHARGPEVEFWVSPTGQSLCDRNEWSLLPFLALSDGAHAAVEEFSYFSLRNKATTSELLPAIVPGAHWKDGGLTPKTTSSSSKIAPATTNKPSFDSSLFGISCTRQIRSDLLKNKSQDVTRSTVQKAVVIIIETPGLLGELRERLGAVTAAWFRQEDFTNSDILVQFQESLKRDATSRPPPLREPYIGLSIREIVHEFRHQTLVLFKALLLQKKVLFYGSKCERLCLLQFALISLIPNLTRNLQDCADPSLDSYAKTITQAASLRTSDRDSLLAYMGLPLQIFGQSAFFCPYTPLQLFDVLSDVKTKSFVAGSTNSLILAQKERYCDILINLDEELTYNRIQILDPSLQRPLTLSAADRRWIDNITQGVVDTWDPELPSRPTTHAYPNSEDAIRLQFEEYLLSLLSTSSYKDFHDTQPYDAPHVTAQGGNASTDPTEAANDFNADFLATWKLTSNNRLFHRLTSQAHIFDIVEPKHPTAGALSMEDVQRRLAQGVADLHLEERTKEARENLGRAFESGKARFWQEVEAFQKKRRSGSRPRSSAGPAVADGTKELDKLDTSNKVTGSTEKATLAIHSAMVGGGAAAGADGLEASTRDRASWGGPRGTATINTNVGTMATNTASSVNNTPTAASTTTPTAKAGQYLSSWGAWARERGREWGERNRRELGYDEESIRAKAAAQAVATKTGPQRKPDGWQT